MKKLENALLHCVATDGKVNSENYLEYLKKNTKKLPPKEVIQTFVKEFVKIIYESDSYFRQRVHIDSKTGRIDYLPYKIKLSELIDKLNINERRRIAFQRKDGSIATYKGVVGNQDKFGYTLFNTKNKVVKFRLTDLKAVIVKEDGKKKIYYRG